MWSFRIAGKGDGDGRESFDEDDGHPLTEFLAWAVLANLLTCITIGSDIRPGQDNPDAGNAPAQPAQIRSAPRP